MAKKTTKVTKSDLDTLADWLVDEINSTKDDAAAAILEMVKGDEADRFDKANERIASCTTEVDMLEKILRWAEGEEEKKEG